MDTWYNGISKELMQNLFTSMPRRIKAVIKANGGQTWYENIEKMNSNIFNKFDIMTKKWSFQAVRFFLHRTVYQIF